MKSTLHSYIIAARRSDISKRTRAKEGFYEPAKRVIGVAGSAKDVPALAW